MWRRDHGKENKATPANATTPALQVPTTTAAAAAVSRPAAHHGQVSSGGSTSIKPLVGFPAASQPAPAPVVTAPSRREAATTVAQAASAAPVVKKSSTLEREREPERGTKKDKEEPSSPKEKEKKKKHREKGDKDKEREKESKRESKAMKLNKEQVVSQMIGASDLGDFKPWYYDESEKPGDFSDGTLRAMRFIAAGYFILAWQNGKVPVGWKRPRKLDDFIEIYGEELVAQAKAKVARSQAELAEREKARLTKFLKGEATDSASDSKKTQIEAEAAEELHTLVERNFVETSIVMPLGRGGTASAFEMRSSFSEDFVEALRKKEEETKRSTMMKEKEKLTENAAVLQEVASMALDGSAGMPALSGSNASGAAVAATQASNQPIDLTNPANTQGKSKAWIMAMERKQKIEAEKQQKLEQEKTEQKQIQEKKEAMEEKERRLQEIQRERLENMDETHVKAPWMLNKKPSMPTNAAGSKEESSSEEDEEEGEEEGKEQEKEEGKEEAKLATGDQGEDGGSLVLVGRSKSGREIYGEVTNGQYDDVDHDKQGLAADTAPATNSAEETKADENARNSDDDMTVKHSDRSVAKAPSEEPVGPVAMWRTALSKKKLEDLSNQSSEKDKETPKEENAAPAWRSVLKSSKTIPDVVTPTTVSSPSGDNIQKSDSNQAAPAGTWGVKLSSKALNVESEKKEEIKQDQLESVPSWARQRKPSADGSAPTAATVEETKKDETKQEQVQSVPSWARQRKPSMDESVMPAVSVATVAKKAEEEEPVPAVAGWRNALKSSKSIGQNDEAAAATSAVVQAETEVKKEDGAPGPAWKAQLKPAAEPKAESVPVDTPQTSESNDSGVNASAIPAWRTQLKSSETKTAETSSTKDAKPESRDSGSGLPTWRTQLKSSTETTGVKAEETTQVPSWAKKPAEPEKSDQPAWAKKSTELEKTSVEAAAVSSVDSGQSESMRKELKELQDEKASIRQEMDKHMEEMQKLRERFDQLEVRLGKLEKSGGGES